jgi:tellurite resistance protein TehA-like permease
MADKCARPHQLGWLKSLYPGYFTLTMATGIIAIAFDMLKMPLAANALSAITFFSWAVLFILYTWRLIVFPKAVLENLLNTRTTFIFFSFVAATDIVGLLLHRLEWQQLAFGCWILSFSAWTALLYCGFSTLTLQHPDRKANVVHGGWLITIVGTQSLVLLGAKIAPQLGEYASYMMVEIYMLWGLGLILYGIFVTLFCYRIFFLDMKVEDYSPLMWVIMGAAAISANAGNSLSPAPSVMPFLDSLHSMVNGVILLCWSWATWWIPLLVIMGIWKHGVSKVPLRYEPMQWSIVFPLGMYTVASYRLALTAGFEPLFWIANLMIWVAIATWGLVMAALLWQIARGFNTLIRQRT